jgi:hypothetical protein
MENALGVLSGKEQLRIGIEKEDILLLSAGVFVAMLLALIIAKQL